MKRVTLRHVWEARKRIAPVVTKTPLIYSPALSEFVGTTVYLKLEHLTTTGSFKVRGAANKILSLTDEERRRGVTTFSTGNFGMSVAYLAKQMGLKAVICISNRVPKGKVAAIRRSGAQVEIYGESQDDAEQRCYQLKEEKGLTVIPPFDDPHVIAGQGTIALELLEDLPALDTVVSGLSGGGLLSGIGITLKSADPSIRVVGVSPVRGAAMYASIQAGKPTVVQEQNTLADSLLGGIGFNNRYTFDMVKRYVDEIVLLEEKEIAQGMAFLFDRHKMVVEGAAAVGVGALLHKKFRPGSQVVLVVSGCSVDTPVILNVIKEYGTFSRQT